MREDFDSVAKYEGALRTKAPANILPAGDIVWRAGWLRGLWHNLTCKGNRPRWTEFRTYSGETACIHCGFVYSVDSRWRDSGRTLSVQEPRNG